MKLEKAIEIVTDIKDEDPELYKDDEQDALNLLIEAGKQIQQIRAYAKSLFLPLLPGETKD